MGAQQDNDVISFIGTEFAPVTISGGSIRGGDGIDTFVGAEAIFTGTTINGNAGDDAFELADLLGSTLLGGQGEDFINVFDVVSSVVNGNKGNDDIVAINVFNSEIFGGQGDDIIDVFGDFSNSSVSGNLGDDLITYTDGGFDDDDFVANGNEGDDTVIGGGGDDTLNGGKDNDEIDGGDGADTITGGLGADTVTGGLGADVFTGVTGDSFAATAGALNTVTFGNGVDWITDFTLNPDPELSDSIVINGATVDIDAVGVAIIVDGTYFITNADPNTTQFAVFGNYNDDDKVFTSAGEDIVNNAFLTFQTGTAQAEGQSIGVTSVEALIVSGETLFDS